MKLIEFDEIELGKYYLTYYVAGGYHCISIVYSSYERDGRVDVIMGKVYDAIMVDGHDFYLNHQRIGDGVMDDEPFLKTDIIFELTNDEVLMHTSVL
jgi:hypothetical protein